jgi:hypothetical protein
MMSQYLYLKDAETDEDLYEIGMKALHKLERFCRSVAPGFFRDYDLFGCDLSEYYEPELDGVHHYFPPRAEVLSELDALIDFLEAAPDGEQIAGRSAAQFAADFRRLRQTIRNRPNARLTAYSWF